MENYATISDKVAEKTKTMKQEALGQSKVNMFENWWKTKAVPALNKANDDIAKALSEVHINWTGVLVLVILAYLAKNGFLEEMPSIKWLVESAVRATEWAINLLQSLIELLVNFLESKFINVFDIFGIFEWMADFLRTIFAL